VEVRVLGPVEACLDGAVVHLTGMQRALLAMLVLDAGRVVGIQRLVDGLWEAGAASAGPARVRMLVSELRRALPGTDLVATRSPGYLLLPAECWLDSEAFTSAVQRARTARSQGRLDVAGDEYTAALALWRGPALGGAATGPFVATEAVRFDELRLLAMEDAAEVDLLRRRYGDAASRLAEVTRHSPPRERAHQLLMLALYRAGRPGDALRMYASLRQRYVEELGLEPGPELRQLHQRILRAEPVPEAPLADAEPASGPPYDPARSPEAPHAAAAIAVRPAQLPPDLADFTGRQHEVAAALTMLETGATVPILALHGKPGVGKSTLAVHVAHRLRPRFPDGQLHVNLAAATEPTPEDPHEVLGRFLAALGIPGQALPEDRAARAALFRSRLAGQRVLIVLDNAASATQVRPLLPGDAGCAVIVTSRSPLAAPLGARALAVDILDAGASRELVGAIIGERRIAAEPTETERLVELCGRLPLALRVAAGRLAESPHWRVGTLVDRLTDERHRLDELRHGGVDVRANLQLSYQALSARAATGLRVLGMLPRTDFATWSVAALLHATLAETMTVVDELIRAQLIEYAGHDRAGQARYRLHDLIRAYAAELAAGIEPPERSAAIERWYGAWLAAAAEAATGLPARPVTPLAGPGHHQPVPELRIAEPLAWFESERVGLLAVVKRAAGEERSYAYQIASAAAKFFELRGDFDDLRALYQDGLAAAQAVGDHRAVALLRCDLAMVDRYQDRHRSARSGYEQARDYFLRTGEVWGVAVAEAGLSVVLRLTGDLEQALRLSLGAIEVFDTAGDRLRAAQARYSAAVIHSDRREWDATVSHLERALPELEASGDQATQCRAWGVLGMVLVWRGEYERAVDYLDRAVTATGRLGLIVEYAYARLALGDLHAAHGRVAQARELFDVSLRLVRLIGDRIGEAKLLTRLAELLGAERRYDEAIPLAERAAQLSSEIGSRTAWARVLTTLGELHLANGNRPAAVDAWVRSRALYQRAGSDYAADVAGRLANLA
jgi:DNA-binding SARP family transcriptional activator/DNA polymerase III delta prime subunit